MASLLSVTKLYNFAFISLFVISSFAAFVTPYLFQVGGENGWTKPTANDTESYNDWATKNRFHVGDSLHFRYQNDSVLLVNSMAYTNCIVSNPESKFDDGNTTFQFDRYGFFYFISGYPDHCEAGQKLVVRVMVHPAVEEISPGSAPSPISDGPNAGDDQDGFSWGPPYMNSTVKLSVASYFFTVFGGVLVIFYLLM